MKKAKEDGKSVKLVRDKLFIDNQRYFPDTQQSHHNDQPHINWKQKANKIRQNTRQENTSRVFHNRRGRNQHEQYQTNDFQPPLSNRFCILADENEIETVGLKYKTPIEKQTYKTYGKREARSPLDVEMKRPKTSECRETIADRAVRKVWQQKW